jgi:hypothetical protein
MRTTLPCKKFPYERWNACGGSFDSAMHLYRLPLPSAHFGDFPVDSDKPTIELVEDVFFDEEKGKQ